MAKMKTNENTPTINFLGKGTSITGDIVSNGDFRIDGELEGSINSKGKVVVGSSGNVKGNIVCQNADISGTVSAKVTVSELLSLKASAKIYGDIVTTKLAIEPGALFTGNCTMGEKPHEKTQFPTNNEGFGQKKTTIK
jgi:cytoskeletal protein CcmA (bactofilin family)